jgi:hypothetical protein
MHFRGMKIRNIDIYREPGQFAGWPANYGLWLWGDEVVTIFAQGNLGSSDLLHERDRSRPIIPRQARSRDGGLAWEIEPFTGHLPGGPTLSADEHVLDGLKARQHVLADRDLHTLEEPIDFLDPETIVLAARTGLAEGALSWFYVSRDRARTWRGPYRFGTLGLSGISARTDIVPFGQHEALFMLTTPKRDGKEGRVFCARTSDGGRSFGFQGFVGGEPEGYAIMPSSVRLPDGKIFSTVRCMGANGGKGWIEAFVSGDEGKSWIPFGRPVENTGPGGNPPSLTLMPDGRLILVYGYRAAPFGLRMRASEDFGRTWTDETIIRNDGGTRDLGYARTVSRPDGTLLSVYYFNHGEGQERFIAASIFDAPR